MRVPNTNRFTSASFEVGQTLMSKALWAKGFRTPPAEFWGIITSDLTPAKRKRTDPTDAVHRQAPVQPSLAQTDFYGTQCHGGTVTLTNNTGKAQTTFNKLLKLF